MIMGASFQRHDIVEFDEFKAKLQEFKNRYVGVVYDLSDPEQEKQARSDRYAIGRVVSALDSKHKELKAPLKARTDLIDGSRKQIKDGLLDMQGKIKEQIEIRENEVRAHAEMLQGMVDEITELAIFILDTDDYRDGLPFTPTSQDIAQRLSILKNINIDESYEERKADAALAHLETFKKLESILDSRIKHEEEKAELDRLRAETEERERKDREEKIKREAVEQERREAEMKAAKERSRFEKERQEAEAKALREIQRIENKRLEAQGKAIREVEDAKRKQRAAECNAKLAAQVERDLIESGQRKAEAKRLAEVKAEEKRKARQTHRTKIHREVMQSFVNNSMDEQDAKFATILIQDGKINHVVINY